MLSLFRTSLQRLRISKEIPLEIRMLHYYVRTVPLVYTITLFSMSNTSLISQPYEPFIFAIFWPLLTPLLPPMLLYEARERWERRESKKRWEKRWENEKKE